MNFKMSICFLMGICAIDAAQILGVYPFPAYSHFQLGDIIFKELAKRGHQMTVISPFEQKEPIKNFNQVIINDTSEKAADMRASLFYYKELNIIEKVFWLDALGYNFTELALNSSNVRKFLKEENHFDLVIIHHFLNDALNGFCYHFNAPCIEVSPQGTPTWFNDKVGLPAPPSYAPQYILSSWTDMNFLERMHNSVICVIIALSDYVYKYPNQNHLLQTYFPGVPHLDDLYYNTSLILFNGHISINEVFPTLPNTIDIAGYHVKPPKKLPNDLQQYLDNATDGVIYFSMGSNLKSKDFPTDSRDGILNVFSKLKQKVLWKWEEDTLPNKPSNVLIRSWFPQQDILAHPNVILFITHGGLLSVIETVYHGKPMFGLPVFADQGLNSVRAQRDGYGRYIIFEELNEDNFRKELHELLSNPQYMINAKKRSNIMHDQPLPPLEKAMFWIEYVLRHKGAPHLKSPALSLKWYQYFLLDIILAFIVCLASVAYITNLFIKKIWALHNSCSRSKKNKAKLVEFRLS